MAELAAVKNSPQALGDKINELYDLRERKRELNAELKEINEESAALEASILAELDAQGTRLSASSRARVSISETTVAQVEDWEAFHDYVRANDAFYLFERRVANAPWRELHQAGETVPGTQPFVRRSLNLRKA